MNLKDRLISKGILNKEDIIKDIDLIEMYHELMMFYGFIPYNEFLALPIPVVSKLYKCMRRDYKIPKPVILMGIAKK